MGANIIMPQLGETVAEGKIVSWFKQTGDVVKAGDRLFEVETDKVTIDVEATESGVITEIRVGDGATAPIGAVVAVLDGAAAAERPTEQSAAPAPTATLPAAPATARLAAVPMTPLEEVPTAKGLFGKAAQDGMRISPLARRLIAESGLDLKALVAEGKNRGLARITERDVRALTPMLERAAALPAAGQATEASVSRVPSTPALTIGPRDEVIPFSTIRQKTADRLAENWRSIPHVFQALEVDFGAIDQVRTARKAAFKAEHGLSLTFLPFITRSVAIALRDFPDINARTDGTRLVRSRDIHIGIAVDLNHKGLVVPVLKNADELTVSGIAKGIGRLVEKARTGKLSGDEMAGGTYSITNNGAFGTQFTSPIINAPQVAILSTDAIKLRPGIIDTAAGPLVVPRLIGTIGQSFDHRAFDGAYSAAFLSRLKAVLETRNWEQDFA
uniref:dihydrolipoamide acetyltransferase family protein n=1 Tax=uncultured Rhizobium sp. TaxID=155567 RepID=UPI002633089D|nr:dihydrolipoamide acetyltransferase family protein [uncultured Rhizobium sp.]